MLMQTGQAARTNPTGWSGEVASAGDARRRRSDLHGRTLRFPSGETYIEDNAGGMVILDNAGRVIKTISISQQEIRYAYDAHGRLSTAQMPGMPLLAPDCFSVDSQGTLSICTSASGAQGMVTRFHLDGSTALINPSGRLVALQAALSTQLKRLRTTVKNILNAGFIGNDDACEFETTLRKLLERVDCDALFSESAAARTLFHIGRMLEHSAQSALQTQLSFQLAHELIFFAAAPNLVPQSDALSTLIRELFRRSPEHAAFMIAQMNMERKYVTANGITVFYTEELMDPRLRRFNEWQCAAHGVHESNRFLRVVMVNVVEQLRIAKRVYGDATPNPDHARAFSTREYGGVFDRELLYLYEAITGMTAPASGFSSGDGELSDGHQNCTCR